VLLRASHSEKVTGGSYCCVASLLGGAAGVDQGEGGGAEAGVQGSTGAV